SRRGPLRLRSCFASRPMNIEGITQACFGVALIFSISAGLPARAFECDNVYNILNSANDNFSGYKGEIKNQDALGHYGQRQVWKSKYGFPDSTECYVFTQEYEYGLQLVCFFGAFTSSYSAQAADMVAEMTSKMADCVVERNPWGFGDRFGPTSRF